MAEKKLLTNKIMISGGGIKMCFVRMLIWSAGYANHYTCIHVNMLPLCFSTCYQIDIWKCFRSQLFRIGPTQFTTSYKRTVDPCFAYQCKFVAGFYIYMLVQSLLLPWGSMRSVVQALLAASLVPHRCKYSQPSARPAWCCPQTRSRLPRVHWGSRRSRRSWPCDRRE